MEGLNSVVYDFQWLILTRSVWFKTLIEIKVSFLTVDSKH